MENSGYIKKGIEKVLSLLPEELNEQEKTKVEEIKELLADIEKDDEN